MKILFFLLFMVVFQQLHAQMVGGQIYLQGAYVEVGINSCGVYGAESQPPGYNGNLGGPLGFVADHEMDGWNNSSPTQPVRCGDYFYPGNPYEAWGIEINGQVYFAMNGSAGGCGYGPSLTGSNTLYSATGGTHNGQWEGDIISGTTNLHICQYTEVPDSELFFSTTITLTNNGLLPLNEIYYVRHLDPDNDVVYSGSSLVFETNNTVVQNPTSFSAEALCTASGPTFGCFLGMLSTGYPNARAFIGGTVGTFPLQIADTWNGNISMGYDTTVGSNNAGIDDCLGISHYWNSILPGQSVKFKFYYVLDVNAIEDATNASQNVEVYVNEFLAYTEGQNLGVQVCSSSLVSDTIKLMAMFCPDSTILVDINSTPNYNWEWPGMPGINLLNPIGDSTLIISSNINDSITYTINGQYNTGSDSGYVVLLLTLVENQPDANFTHDYACTNSPTCFYDNSTTNPGSSIEFYQWDFDEPGLIGFSPDTCVLFQNNAIHHVTLTITSSFGCVDIDTIQIIPDELFPEQFTTISVCSGEPLELSVDSIEGDSYLWFNGDTTTSTFVSVTDLFQVTIYNECGITICWFDVLYISDLVNLQLPNVLTLNNDGINDAYIVQELNFYDNYQLDFYDRWGLHLFSTDNVFLNPWKGTIGADGPIVSPGVYYVVMKVVNCHGKEVYKTQAITVFN